MGMLPVMNEPPMLRRMHAEDEFRVTVAKVYGADRAAAEAERLIERSECDWRKDARIVRSMIPNALRVLQDQNEAEKAGK